MLKTQPSAFPNRQLAHPRAGTSARHVPVIADHEWRCWPPHKNAMADSLTSATRERLQSRVRPLMHRPEGSATQLDTYGRQGPGREVALTCTNESSRIRGNSCGLTGGYGSS